MGFSRFVAQALALLLVAGAAHAAAPVATTSAATAVTSSSATLNGAANPNNEATFGYFRYSLTNPVTCNDSFGTRAPASGASDLGAGSSAAPFSQGISGLTAGTTYYFCAIASNGSGTSFGAVLSFTIVAAPSTTSTAASIVTSSGATLNGSANPNGDATFGHFRYSTTDPGSCNDSFGTRAPGSSVSDSSLGAGGTPVNYNRVIAGLTPATTYYYCAIANNGLGTTFGAVLSLTTLPAVPTVTTNSATLLTSTGATLNASANPGGDATTGWFRYATVSPGTCNDSFGTRAPVFSASDTLLGSGNSPVSYAQAITGLTVGTTYYYCGIAANTVGTSFGAVLSFTIVAAPSTSSTAASIVTSSGATLNGSANPNGDATFGHFRYSTTDPGSCNDSFGTRAPGSSVSDSSLGAGGTPVNYNRVIAGLTPATTYYYCAIANNGLGTTFGAVLSLTTLAAAPTVTTSSATNRTGAGATLNGTANPGGDATTGWFRYATVSPGTCNDSFGTRAPGAGGTALGAGTSSQPWSQAITGLSPGTTYFVCAIAQNSIGTSVGSVVSFTTPLPPAATTVAATSISNVGAQLNGTGNPNGATTTGWFRYAMVSPGACDDSFGTRAPSSGGTALGSGNSPVNYARTISGLTPGATYYFCAIVQSVEGTSFGSVLSFTTQNIALVTYNVVLEGWQQVAPYVVTPATGGGTATFNPVTKELALNLTYSGLGSSETGAHIHGPGARGANAGILFSLAAGSPKTDVVTLTPTQETQLSAGQLYVNIHTTNYPNGEIRGQIDNLGATVMRDLTVQVIGPGTGTVTGTSDGATVVSCSTSNCIIPVPDGKQLSLTATPTNGSTFVAWYGSCTGVGPCNVTMNASKPLQAYFDPPTTPSSADLAISQSFAPNPASVGKDLLVTLTVTNNGPATANFVTITYHIPAWASFVWVHGTSPDCSIANNIASCVTGTLAAGGSISRRVVIRPISAGLVTSEALVNWPGVDPVSANGTSSLALTVSTTPPGTPVQRYRLYSDVTKEHHFTTDLNEYNVLGTYVGTWVQEGNVGKILNNPGSFGGVEAVPYYRLYDNSTRWHHWTTDANEYYTLGFVYSGWNMEGVDGWILPSNAPGTTQLYRLNYPALGALHHWTIDANEYTTLITSFGWIGEPGAGFVVQ